jgi:hypothetical protein
MSEEEIHSNYGVEGVNYSGPGETTAMKKKAELHEGDYVKINSEFAEYPNGFVQSVDDGGETAKVVYDNPGFEQGVGPLRTFHVKDLEIVRKDPRQALKKEEGTVQTPVEVTGINDTKIATWFERDHQHVALIDASTEQKIVEWLDEDVTYMVESGFLDPRDYHGSAYDYAKTNGLLVEKPWQETWQEEQERAGFMFDDAKQEWIPKS